MTREDKLALGGGAAFFALLIACGWSQGAFAGPPAPTPIPPKPEPGKLPTLAPEPAEPLVPSEPASVPPELAAIADGGVPIDGGWSFLAWYSYRGWWIRIDTKPGVDSSPGHEHGMYRWTIVGGSTPLATWSTEGKGFGAIVDFSDENADGVAKHAAAWVDAVAG